MAAESETGIAKDRFHSPPSSMACLDVPAKNIFFFRIISALSRLLSSQSMNLASFFLAAWRSPGHSARTAIHRCLQFFLLFLRFYE
ncbi:hypothetical protein [Gluconacetobacter takamatsuzukensis]|uniref:Uncharacterized protein n=1 Tax=Gluconacetobacter takamatsuzukensis TaxID=1286190 RepID=A0A7W4KDZ4_9PROT|nr:hypothetical protein [Gluconacetobacter takamatsuzukensis]MBB2205146.1 hypothetical protein [Gluconacetobacter takamatsuzukensis]